MKTTFFKLSTVLKLFGACLLISLLQGCGPTYVVASNDYRQEPAYPDWAPQYENPGQVSYYYMPDIQTYYDVRNRQFIYYDNGAWIYSSYISPQYSSYDLYNAYIIVLDYNSHEPWRHHQDYYSHYPPYYYQTENVNNTTIVNNNYYGSAGSGQPSRGGYNENAKTTIYRSANNNQSTRRSAVTPASKQNEPLRSESQPNNFDQQPRRQVNNETINKPEAKAERRVENYQPEQKTNVNNRPSRSVNSEPENKPEPKIERRFENDRNDFKINTNNQSSRSEKPEQIIKQENQNDRHENVTGKKEPSSEIRSEPTRKPEQQRNNVQPSRKENKPPVRKDAPKAEDKKKEDDKRR
jgi:hypothetical protein